MKEERCKGPFWLRDNECELLCGVPTYYLLSSSLVNTIQICGFANPDLCIEHTESGQM
jgi:hypothetical protein